MSSLRKKICWQKKLDPENMFYHESNRSLNQSGHRDHLSCFTHRYLRSRGNDSPKVTWLIRGKPGLATSAILQILKTFYFSFPTCVGEPDSNFRAFWFFFKTLTCTWSLLNFTVTVKYEGQMVSPTLQAMQGSTTFIKLSIW